MTNRTDNFNRADASGSLGTPSDSGSAWGQPGGVGFNITSNKAASASNPGVAALALLESSVSDVDVQVTLSTVGSDAGLIGRYSGSGDYFTFIAAPGPGFILRVLNGGSPTGIQTYAGTPTSGDVIRLRMNGTTIEGYVNGVLRCSGTNSSHSTGTEHGFYAYEDTSTRFDDFSITEIGGGGGSSSGAAAHYYRQLA